MIKKYTFYIIYILFLFSILELGTRLIFPDFKENNIFYDKNEYHRVSKGIDTYFQIVGKTKFRVSKLNEKIEFNEKKSIWFLGDSVTNGYGVEFEDTYYSVFSRKLDTEINIYNSSNYNSSYMNTFSNLNGTIEKYLKPQDIIIYQFNFNDIIDIAQKIAYLDRIKNTEKNEDINNNINISIKDEDIPHRRKIISLIVNTNVFRYKYLNHSAFFKLIQHHASIFVRKTKGSCEERNLDALGPYTYSYFGKNYEEKSLKLWDLFTKSIIQTNTELKNKNINFLVLITPISLQVKNHEKINKLNYDLKCSTNNGHEYLLNILNENKIQFINVLPYFNKFIENENNKSKYLFHTYDTNHPNKKGHELIADAVFQELRFLN